MKWSSFYNYYQTPQHFHPAEIAKHISELCSFVDGVIIGANKPYPPYIEGLADALRSATVSLYNCEEQAVVEKEDGTVCLTPACEE